MTNKRIEINPGEWFSVANRTIIVENYESVLGDVIQLGTDYREAVYMFTFTGRVNHTKETDSVTVALPIKDAFNLMGDILHGLELFKKANEK